MKRLKKAALILFLGLPARADDAGTRAAAFLTLPVDARAAALGEAFTSLADGASSIYWNPAGLTRLKRWEAALMHAPYVESSYFDFAGVGSQLGRNGAIGLGGQFFSAGSIDKADASGNTAGTLTPSEWAVSLALAHRFPFASLGLTGKWIRSSLIDTAQTGAADIGLTTPWYGDRVSLGAVVTNIGGKLQYDQVKEKLPMQTRVGGGWRVMRGVTFGVDGTFSSNEEVVLSGGGEAVLFRGRSFSGAFRAGANTRPRDIDGLAGASMGLGLTIFRTSVDYAIAPMGNLGLTHRISLRYR